jgi:hypothetical protein
MTRLKGGTYPLYFGLSRWRRGWTAAAVGIERVGQLGGKRDVGLAEGQCR